jgi:hypothetical protein
MISRKRSLQLASELFEKYDDVPDDDLWSRLILAACVGGQRARKIGRADIEELCHEFVKRLQEASDLPYHRQH